LLKADPIGSSNVSVSTLTVGPHYPPYRPYLVRALTGVRTSPGNFTFHLYGDTLLVDNTLGGERASQFPLIIFLQAPPDGPRSAGPRRRFGSIIPEAVQR